MSDATGPNDLASEVAALDWYHTLRLTPSIETRGWFDTRPVVSQTGMPESLDGLRCLDVATFDGFWAFEMEKRGASEVVAIDVLDPRQWDWPRGSSPETIETIGRRKARGEGFEIAKRCLKSAVQRHELNVYDLDESVGSFDFVYLGSLLLHLRDPVRALERIRMVCEGRLLMVENVDLALTLAHPRKPVAMFDGIGRPWWWRVNSAALKRLAASAGFTSVHGPRLLFMPPGPGQPVLRRPSPRVLATREGREALVTALKGDPHAALMLE